MVKKEKSAKEKIPSLTDGTHYCVYCSTIGGKPVYHKKPFYIKV